MHSGAAGRESSPHHRTDQGDLFRFQRCCINQPAAELWGGEQTLVLNFPDPKPSLPTFSKQTHPWNQKHTALMFPPPVYQHRHHSGLKSLFTESSQQQSRQQRNDHETHNVSVVFSKTHTQNRILMDNQLRCIHEHKHKV